ncbi:conserved hypothetical protein [Neospora caninum Liverpool]|uniref:Uncharacterized protein n=1 Tax=Neospora caninum (strain Liverpool) TaxID=572307 RepID=F0VK01_NEOCL|nr:conserved hypothetical protein [Neospora caninum Liverpool]CBZ53231.1 conserved hypothetical protein [Neospora caninum Liverpool]CEL67221.1 TPA: hypothetical protein BN1204_030180 [Neospora caninum Liverpool]|eukprot:XP_003883263.1 conserved hypothetical protein [Neospora caninum Liverpool]
MLDERSQSSVSLDSSGGGAASSFRDPEGCPPQAAAPSNPDLEKNCAFDENSEKTLPPVVAASRVSENTTERIATEDSHVAREEIFDRTASSSASESFSEAELSASELTYPPEASKETLLPTLSPAKEMSPALASEAMHNESQNSPAFASPVGSRSSSPLRSPSFASLARSSQMGPPSSEPVSCLISPPSSSFIPVDPAEPVRTANLTSSASAASSPSPSRAPQPRLGRAQEGAPAACGVTAATAPAGSPEYFEIYTPVAVPGDGTETGSSFPRGPDSAPTSLRGSVVSSCSSGTAGRTGVPRGSLTSVSAAKPGHFPSFNDSNRQSLTSLSSVSDASDTAAVFLSHLRKETGGHREGTAGCGDLGRASRSSSPVLCGEGRGTGPVEKLTRASRLASFEGSLLQPLPTGASTTAKEEPRTSAEKGELPVFLLEGNRDGKTLQEHSEERHGQEGPFSQLLADATAELRDEDAQVEERGGEDSRSLSRDGEESRLQSLVQHAFNCLNGDESSPSLEEVSAEARGHRARRRRQSVPGFFGSQTSDRLPLPRTRDVSVPRGRREVEGHSPYRVNCRNVLSMSLREESETELSIAFKQSLGRFDAQENSAEESDRSAVEGGAGGFEKNQLREATSLFLEDVQDIIDVLSGPQRASVEGSEQRFGGLEQTHAKSDSLFEDQAQSLERRELGKVTCFSKDRLSCGDVSLQNVERELRLAVGFVAPQLSAAPSRPAVSAGLGDDPSQPGNEANRAATQSPVPRQRGCLPLHAPTSVSPAQHRPLPCAVGSWTSMSHPGLCQDSQTVRASASVSLLPRLLPSPSSSCLPYGLDTKPFCPQIVLPSPASYASRPSPGAPEIFPAAPQSPLKDARQHGAVASPLSAVSPSSSGSGQSDACVWGACADSSGALFMTEEETAQLWKEAKYSNALLDYVAAIFRRMVELRQLLAPHGEPVPSPAAEDEDLISGKEIADFWMTYAPLQNDPYPHGVEPRLASSSPRPTAELHLDAGRLARVIAGEEGFVDLVRFTRLVALIDGDIPHSLQSAAGLLRLRLIFLFFSDLPNARAPLGAGVREGPNLDQEGKTKLVHWREWNWTGFRHALLHTPAVTQGGVAACPTSLRAALAALGKPGRSVATFADFHALVARLVVRGTSRLFRINLFCMKEGPDGLHRVPRFPLDSLPYPPLIVRRRVLCCTVPTCPCQQGGPCATAAAVEAQETGDTLPKRTVGGCVSWVAKPEDGKRAPDSAGAQSALRANSLTLPVAAQGVSGVAYISPVAAGSNLGGTAGAALPPPPHLKADSRSRNLPTGPTSPLHPSGSFQVSPLLLGVPSHLSAPHVLVEETDLVGAQALGHLRAASSAGLVHPALSVASTRPVPGVAGMPSFVSPLASHQDTHNVHPVPGAPLHPVLYPSGALSGPLERAREGSEGAPVLLHAPNLLLPLPTHSATASGIAASLTPPQSLPLASSGRPCGGSGEHFSASPFHRQPISSPRLVYAGETSPAPLVFSPHPQTAIEKRVTEEPEAVLSGLRAPGGLGCGDSVEIRAPVVIPNHYNPLARDWPSPVAVRNPALESETRSQLQFFPHPSASFAATPAAIAPFQSGDQPPLPRGAPSGVSSLSPRPLGFAAVGEGATELRGFPARARVVAEVCYEARHKNLFDRVPLLGSDFANLPVLDVRQVGSDESEGLLRHARTHACLQEARGSLGAALCSERGRPWGREPRETHARSPPFAPLTAASSFTSSPLDADRVGNAQDRDGGPSPMPSGVGGLMIAARPVPTSTSPRPSSFLPPPLPQSRGNSERRRVPSLSRVPVPETEQRPSRSVSPDSERWLRRGTPAEERRSQSPHLSEAKAFNGIPGVSSGEPLGSDARRGSASACAEGGPLAPPCLASPEAHSPLHVHRPRALWMRDASRGRTEREAGRSLERPQIRPSEEAGDGRRPARSESSREKCHEAPPLASERTENASLGSLPANLSREELDGLQRGLRLASFEKFCILQRLSQAGGGPRETTLEGKAEETPDAAGDRLFVRYELGRVERDFAEAIFAPFLYTFCFLLEKRTGPQAASAPSLPAFPPQDGTAPVSPLGALRVLQDAFALLTKPDALSSPTSHASKDALDLAAEVARVLCPAPFRPGRVIAFVCCLHWLRERGRTLRRGAEGALQAPEEGLDDSYSLLPLLPFSLGDRLEASEVAHVVGPSIRAVMRQMEAGFDALLSGAREGEEAPARQEQRAPGLAEGGRCPATHEAHRELSEVGVAEPLNAKMRGKSAAWSRDEELERRMATRTTAGDSRGWSCLSFQSVSASHGEAGRTGTEDADQFSACQVPVAASDKTASLPGKATHASVLSCLSAIPACGSPAALRVQSAAFVPSSVVARPASAFCAPLGPFSAPGVSRRALPQRLQSAGEKDRDRGLGSSLSSAESLQEPRPRSRGGEPTFTSLTAQAAASAAEKVGRQVFRGEKERDVEEAEFGDERRGLALNRGENDEQAATRHASAGKGRRGLLPTPKPVLPDLGVLTAGGRGERGPLPHDAASRLSSASRSVSGSEGFASLSMHAPAHLLQDGSFSGAEGQTCGPTPEQSRPQGHASHFETLPEIRPSDRLPRSRRPTLVPPQRSPGAPSSSGVSCSRGFPSAPRSEASQGLSVQGFSPEEHGAPRYFTARLSSERSRPVTRGENNGEGSACMSDEATLPRRMHERPVAGARPSRSLLSDSLGSLVEDIVATPPLSYSGFTTPVAGCPEQAGLKSTGGAGVGHLPSLSSAPGRQASLLSPETEAQICRHAPSFVSPPTARAPEETGRASGVGESHPRTTPVGARQAFRQAAWAPSQASEAVSGPFSGVETRRELTEPQRSSLPLRRSPSLVFRTSPRAESGSAHHLPETKEETGKPQSLNPHWKAGTHDCKSRQGRDARAEEGGRTVEAEYSEISRCVSPLEELLMAERELFFSPAALLTDSAPETRGAVSQGEPSTWRHSGHREQERGKLARGGVSQSPPYSPSALSNSLAEFFIGPTRPSSLHAECSPALPPRPFSPPSCEVRLEARVNEGGNDACMPSLPPLQKLSQADLLDLDEDGEETAKDAEPADGPVEGLSTRLNASETRGAEPVNCSASPRLAAVPAEGSTTPSPLSTLSRYASVSSLPRSAADRLGSSSLPPHTAETARQAAVSGEAPAAAHLGCSRLHEQEGARVGAETSKPPQHFLGTRLDLETPKSGDIQGATAAIAHAAAVRAFKAAQENETAQCLEEGRMAVAAAAAAAAAGGTRHYQEETEGSLGRSRRRSSFLEDHFEGQGERREGNEAGRLGHVQETPSFWKKRGLAAAAAAAAEARAERRNQEKELISRDALVSHVGRPAWDLDRVSPDESSEEASTAGGSAHVSFRLGDRTCEGGEAPRVRLSQALENSAHACEEQDEDKADVRADTFQSQEVERENGPLAGSHRSREKPVSSVSPRAKEDGEDEEELSATGFAHSPRHAEMEVTGEREHTGQLSDLAGEPTDGETERRENAKVSRKDSDLWKGKGESVKLRSEVQRGGWEEGDKSCEPFGRHSRNLTVSTDDANEGEEPGCRPGGKDPLPVSLEGRELGHGRAECEKPASLGVPDPLADEQ